MIVRVLFIHKTPLIVIGLLLLLALGFFVYQQKEAFDTNILSFSNTQELGAQFHTYLDQQLTHVPDFYSTYHFPPPPTNTSTETNDELEYLHQLAINRTEVDRANIDATIDLATTHFHNTKLPELLNTNTRPRSHELIFGSLDEFNYIVMEYKVRFNRVRPSYLDSTLETAIPVPKHPAYPSGHAAQSMLIALILCDLDPLNCDRYRDSAYKIAHYREIAGVHYPSDSTAGQKLAEAYFTELKTTTWYQDLSHIARNEW